MPRLVRCEHLHIQRTPERPFSRSRPSRLTSSSSLPPAASYQRPRALSIISFHGAAPFSVGRRRCLLHVRRPRPAARAAPLQALPRPTAAQILQRSVPEGHGVQEVQLVPERAGAGRSPRPTPRSTGGQQEGGEAEDGGIDGDVDLRRGGAAAAQRGRMRHCYEVEEIGRGGR